MKKKLRNYVTAQTSIHVRDGPLEDLWWKWGSFEAYDCFHQHFPNFFLAIARIFWGFLSMHEFFPFNFSFQEYILFTSLTAPPPPLPTHLEVFWLHLLVSCIISKLVISCIYYSDHYLLRREHLMTFNLHVKVKEAINMFLDMETNVQTIATVLL